MSQISYNVELNFKRDFIENLVSIFANYNINIDVTEEPENIKIKFFNFMKRLIPVISRTVLKSREFSCPSELEMGLALLIEKISKGDDLFAHLSKQIVNLAYNDSLLNDWGIYHLHLGTTVEPDGFITRTGPVLFARFDDTNAYLINVMVHGNWTKQQMIKVLHNNWPESIKNYRLIDVIGLEHVPTDDDIKIARKFGFNTAVEIEPGVVYTSIGGGYTTSKTSMDVMSTMFHYNRLVEDLEKYVKENSQKYGEILSNKYGYSGKDLFFKLALQENEYFAYEQNTKVAFSLGRH
ncbi:MAG TPA: hypothetical protein ENO27_00040 [Caldithrix sp.]|nr:hypothetical protein [Caldithrix sp.]